MTSTQTLGVIVLLAIVAYAIRRAFVVGGFPSPDVGLFTIASAVVSLDGLATIIAFSLDLATAEQLATKKMPLLYMTGFLAWALLEKLWKAFRDGTTGAAEEPGRGDPR